MGFVSDEQRKAAFASMRERGCYIDYFGSTGSRRYRPYKLNEYCVDFRPPKVMYKAVCSDCCAETQVPFKPDPDRPVYCRECLPNHRKPTERYKGKLKNHVDFGNPKKINKAICSGCGVKIQLSFIPKHHGPIYCLSCLLNWKEPGKAKAETKVSGSWGSVTEKCKSKNDSQILTIETRVPVSLNLINNSLTLPKVERENEYPIFICDNCGKRFTNKKDLEEHVASRKFR